LPSKTASQNLDAIKALETKFEAVSSRLAGQIQGLQIGLQAFPAASAKDRPLVNADERPVIELENPADDRNRNASHEAWIKDGIHATPNGLTVDQDRRPDAEMPRDDLGHVRNLIDACSRPVSPGPDDSGRNGSGETEPKNPLSPSASAAPPSRNYSIPYSVPLRHPSSSSKIVEAKSAFKISGKNYKDPIAIALCPQGQHVGYLFSDRIIVYKLDASKGEVGPPVFVDLDSHVRWKHLQLAGPYLVAWGSLCSLPAARSVSCPACRIQNNVITLTSSNYGTSRGHGILTPLSE
jgi:hypothetical protein